MSLMDEKEQNEMGIFWDLSQNSNPHVSTPIRHPVTQEPDSKLSVHATTQAPSLTLTNAHSQTQTMHTPPSSLRNTDCQKQVRSSSPGLWELPGETYACPDPPTALTLAPRTGRCPKWLHSHLSPNRFEERFVWLSDWQAGGQGWRGERPGAEGVLWC